MEIYLLIVKHLIHPYLIKSWNEKPSRILIRSALAYNSVDAWTLTVANALLETGKCQLDEYTTYYLKKVVVEL